MGITVDVTYKSLNRYTEVLCGDKVEFLQTEDSNIMVLADGMENGVKANVPSTLTSRILETMFLNGATLEECMNTISETLPICQVRQVTYSTFSILQVYHDGDVCLVEYDNPGCIFIRNGELVEISKDVRVMRGREISEYRLKIKKGDALILMNDGTIYAGIEELLNLGWLWQDIADYAMRQYPLTVSAIRLTASASGACDELYQLRPGDDTTVVCMRTIDSKPVHLVAGPAGNPEDGVRMVRDFMDGASAKAIVYGGTSTTIVFRVLGKKLGVSPDYVGPEMPLIAYTNDMDLVTGGVLILNRVPQLLRRYMKNETVSEGFFQGLDKPNGDSMVAKMFVEGCTEVHLYVGRAINNAYQNPGLPFDLGIRQNLAEQLRHVIEGVGKTVVVTYY